MAYGARLESVLGVTTLGGSNPPPSATHVLLRIWKRLISLADSCVHSEVLQLSLCLCRFSRGGMAMDGSK